jgi:hypothetical protein
MERLIICVCICFSTVTVLVEINRAFLVTGSHPTTKTRSPTIYLLGYVLRCVTACVVDLLISVVFRLLRVRLAYFIVVLIKAIVFSCFRRS